MRDEHVTVPVAAVVLSAFVADYLRAAGESRPRREITPRQVRYCMEGLGWLDDRPVQMGESRLLTSADLYVLAVYWLLLFVGVSQRQAWAGVLYASQAIRDGCNHPERRLCLQVWRGLVSVVPAREVDPSATVVELYGVRAHVDRIVAAHRAAQPWEWAGWRKVPARELPTMR